MKNEKIKVIFKNERVIFETFFTGDINDLRDKISIVRDNSNDYIYAYKTYDESSFSYHIRQHSIEITYDFVYSSQVYEEINLNAFKNLVEPYNFKIENMRLVKEEKKGKRK